MHYSLSFVCLTGSVSADLQLCGAFCVLRFRRFQFVVEERIAVIMIELKKKKKTLGHYSKFLACTFLHRWLCKAGAVFPFSILFMLIFYLSAVYIIKFRL